MNFDTMTLEDAIVTLKEYQVWRKGGKEDLQLSPVEIAIAIDIVIDAAEELASMVSE